MHRNTERPRNAAGEGMFRLNTDGVLLRGTGCVGGGIPAARIATNHTAAR
ncbi:hypothetical protein [Bacteroides ovatus]|nr:hypothetical protein [Bacteroides ovatus]MCS2459086.1 hypothetical protein [Bacteroides ovatus]UVQ39509.1 hypothetical protein NXU82_10650 [Bacteroides ovatus]